MVKDLGLLSGIAHKNGEGKIKELQALDLISRNVYRVLGLNESLDGGENHFVIHEGNPLPVDSKVKGVWGGTGRVDSF